MNEQLAKQILKIFANNPFDAYNHKQISSRIGAGSKAERQEVIRTMQELAEQKHLVEDSHKGKYKINPKSIDDELMPQNYVVGTIDMKQGGKAYVIPEEEGREDIQIAPNNTHHALHGDTVKVLMFPQRKMHKPEGQVVEILKRAKTRFVGVIQKQERFAFMVSDSRTMQVDIFIHIDDLAGAENGEKVLVEMTDWPERMNNPVGKVIKRLGKPGDNNVEMQSILAEYDFPLDFPKEVEEEAKKIKKPTKKEISSRRDFRDVTTFTIDPADAKDFDDALSFRELPNGHVEVGVHIADVSYYVKPGSAIDREAYERGTSVYLVDRTIPMLPEKLCNEVCSLRQDEEKLCFSVVMEMDAKGKVHNTWMGKTVIKSDRRMAYEEAQEIIENGDLKNEKSADAVTVAILKLHSIAEKLRVARYKSGAINFETQEVKFQLDENAKPIGVYIKESKEANWLIEEFMLLANRSVAEYIGKPTNRVKSSKNSTTRTFVYRVHDEPNPEKLNTFVEFVAKLGFSMKTSSRKALAESYNRLFENISGRGEEHMVDTIAIRTMSKAYYSTENIGHYGLAFPYYTHFTSPIRRYPDLMVHRLLERYLEGGASVNADEYEDYCRHCSVMEKKAADAERTSVKYKQAEYLADKLGQVFPALISGVSKWGIYAEIEGNKCEGMIPIGSLKDDYYMLDEDNYQVIGRRHGRCYKLGYPVHIRVRKVDLLKKQIDFDLVEEEDTRAPKHESKKKSHKETQKPKSHGRKKKGAKRGLMVLACCLLALGCQQVPQVPAEPDYADTTQWFVADRGAGVDVFYITSTETDDYPMGGAVWYFSDTYNDSLRALLQGEMTGVDQLLAGDLNFYSPYYRQCSMETFTADSLVAERMPLAMGDVKRAFDYYIEHLNGGRPFIVAGFSQGAIGVVELLKHMDDEAYSRMVAAYVIGWKVTDDDLAATTHILAARDSADLGVTVCYNSVRTPQCAIPMLSEGNRMAINPLNWRTDGEPATTVFRGDTLTVTLDTASLLLCVDGYTRNDYMLPLVGVDGNYHCLDITLYAEAIRRNIALRAKLMH